MSARDYKSDTHPYPWGGKRKGAGRSALPQTKRSRAVTIALKREARAHLSALARGWECSQALAVSRALELAMHKEGLLL